CVSRLSHHTLSPSPALSTPTLFPYTTLFRSLPTDPNTIVWKYLDLSKFVDLLLTRQLFMSRADKFEDQYEGTFSEPTFEEIRKRSEEHTSELQSRFDLVCRLLLEKKKSRGMH